MRLHSIRALNPRPEENLQVYKKLAKEKFPNSEFPNQSLHSQSHPKVSCLHDSFDDNEDLLGDHQYREGKRPGNFMLSTNRQFLIPIKNKKS